MIKKSKLFGTDGIRGQAGDFPLDDVSLRKLGYSLTTVLEGSKIVFGRDTRISGDRIEKLLSEGISERTEIHSCGVIPTPGLSYITEHLGFDYGIMITASHNPYYDNGIKIFSNNGEKISGQLEENIENIFYSTPYPTNRLSPNINQLSGRKVYRNFLLDNATIMKNERVKVIIDCANGATFEVAPEIFEKLGFEVIAINIVPNGKNINEKSGSTDIECLKRKVLAEKAFLGIAYDGDGDRVIFIDEKGNILNGDHSLYLLSEYLLGNESEFNKIVIGTVMSNLGLEEKFREMKIQFMRTKVGDKNVYGEMKNTGSMLGGEQSGHIILRKLQKTGDGILTSIFFIKALFDLNFKASDIFNSLILYPQTTRDISVKEKRDLDNWQALKLLINEFQNKFGQHSRVLIRYSGTESKIRLMIESKYDNIIRENMSKFESFIKLNIGE